MTHEELRAMVAAAKLPLGIRHGDTTSLHDARGETVGIVYYDSVASMLVAAVNSLPELLDEIKRLRDIVDQLPKTKDGVPIQNGMRVWFKHPELDQVWEFRVPVKLGTTTVRSMLDSDDYWEIDPRECYSTKEAAEKEKL